MATICTFTGSHTVFDMLNEMFYAMGNDSCKSGKVYYNHCADSNSLHDNDYTHFYYSNHVEWIEFLMYQPAFREHMSFAPGLIFNDAEVCIYSEVRLSDWW